MGTLGEVPCRDVPGGPTRPAGARGSVVSLEPRERLATPVLAASRQLITVEAATSRATYATARAWTRVDGCWTEAGGSYVARVGRNGVRTNKREADGATPAGTFPIGGTMYGNSPSPGVSYQYVRLRCGDWWVEDSRSPAYNTFQRVGCGRKPPFKVTTPDMSTSPRAYATWP